MAPTSFPPKIFTIGHSNVSAQRIIELLVQNNIQILVDVRSSPYSQYCPQFNREVFEKTISKSGIAYKYAGDYLGGRPKDPSCYKDGQIPTGHVNFLDKVDYSAIMTKEFFLKGIERLIDLTNMGNVAIMCSEEDPLKCHRHHLIAWYLVYKKGVEVFHIRGNGNLEEDVSLRKTPEKTTAQQPSLFQI